MAADRELAAAQAAMIEYGNQRARDQADANDAEVSAIQTHVTELEAEVKRLNDLLNAPASSGTLYGLNFSADTSTISTKWESRAKTARIFLQGLGGVNFANDARVKRALAAGVKIFVISWKDKDLDHLKTFLATIPKGLTIYACFNHEPENDAGKPGDAAYKAWSTEWKRQWTLQSPVIRAAGAIPTQILMAYTLYPGSKRTISEWTAPKGTVDVFGFDAYINSYTPQQQVDSIVAATKAAGLTKTMIAETGSQTSDTNRGAKLADLKKRMEAAPKSGVTFVTAIYWNAADPGFDARLNDKDADIWFGSAT